MKDLREWVLTAERALLYTIGFNFQIRHPQVSLPKHASKPFSIVLISIAADVFSQDRPTADSLTPRLRLQ